MVYVCCFPFNWHTKDTIIDKPPELKQSKTIKKCLWVLQTAVKCFDKPLNALICHSDWALWIVFAHPVLIKWHAPNTIPCKTQGCFPSESLFSQKNLRLSVPRGSAFIGDYFYCQINITYRTSMPEIREIRYNKLRTCRQYFLEGSSHCWFWRFDGPAHPFQWFRSDFSIPPTSLQMDKENDSVTHDFGMKFFLLLCRILEERITSVGWNETESCQSRDMVNHEWTHNYSLCVRLLVEYRVSWGLRKRCPALLWQCVFLIGPQRTILLSSSLNWWSLLVHLKHLPYCAMYY